MKTGPDRRQRQAVQRPVVDAGRCTGCGRCVGACAPHVLSLAVQDWKKRAVLDDPGGCTGCRLSALRCPFDAITMQAPGPG